MKIQFLKNAFEKGKKVPAIFRAGEIKELPDAIAKEYIDEEKAAEFKPEKPAKEAKAKPEKPAKEAKAKPEKPAKTPEA